MKLRHARRTRTTGLCLLAWVPLLLAGAGWAEAQTKAYVAHKAANVVSVIDTATGVVMGTVPVGAGPRESP